MGMEVGGQTDVAGDTAATGVQDAVGGATEGQTGQETMATGEADAGAPPAYAPNYRYKYVTPDGKDAEGELPDLFKPLIKDADSEKQLRDLHEKSLSLDFIKSGRAKAQQERDSAVTELSELKSGIEQLRQFVAAKDMDSFFEALQIPEQVVLEYALAKAQYARMTPEQRASYDAQIARNREIASLQQQNQFLQERSTQAAVQAREVELNVVLGRPEIATVAQAFDQKVGRIGAFRAEVIRRGQHHALTSGQDIAAEAVISEMVQFYSPLVAQAAPQAVNAPAIVQPSGKPTLPNLAGKSASPVKSAVRSLDDLRKRAAAMA